MNGDMESEPIELRIILPQKTTPASGAQIRRLHHLMERGGVISLKLSVKGKSGGAFDARISFDDGENASNEPVSPHVSNVESRPDLATEQEIRSAALSIAKDPLFHTISPSKCVYELMSRLGKPVRLKVFVDVCRDVLKLNPETVRGSLNKNRGLYCSVERGVWGTQVWV